MKKIALDRLLAELEPLLELDDAAADRRLARIAAEDPVLAEALAEALAADRHGGSLFDFELDLEFASPPEAPPEPGLRAGLAIGPWRLERELGRGGMGQVWLARRDDDQYDVEVAIKFVDGVGRDSLFSDQVRRERQILANLDHPGIARLVDGGVRDDGTPWYAMEYVRGQPLDRYCAEHVCSLTGILRLMVCVAGALHYAHQRLIVHRDLKPGNILVDEDGNPHLLDFGIAKLIADDPPGQPGAMTLLAAATPAYAAPEQRRGETVGTTADVYALGVILYELITGVRPEIAISPDADAGRGGPLPSEALRGDRGLRRRVRGDIDSIVAQAMAPDPAARYASAEALAADIERYLVGHPVLARRAGTAYRIRKFVRRHWLPVSFGTAAIAALCLALVVSLVQTRRAEQALARAGAVQQFLISVFDAAEPGNYEAGLVVPRRDLAERAAERLEVMLARQPDARIDLLIAIGRILRQLGFPERARPLLEQAVAELDRQPAADRAAVRLEALFELGQVLSLDEDMARAADRLQAADEIAARMEAPPVARAAILFQLGLALSDLRRIEPALDALDRAARHASAHDGSLQLLPRIRLLTALTLDRAGRRESAIAIGEQAVADARRILGPAHERTASALSTVGGILRRAGRLSDAERMHREAVQIGMEGYGSPNPASINNLATVLRDLGRFADAARWQRQALALAESSFGEHSATTARYRRNLGLFQAGAGMHDQAIANLEQAWRDHSADAGEDHSDSRLIRAQLVRELVETGRLDPARNHVRALGPSEADSGTPRSRLLVDMAIASLALAEGRAGEALERLQRATEAHRARAERDPLDTPERVELPLLLGDAFAATGDSESARAAWLEARERSRRLLGEDHPLRLGLERRLEAQAISVSASGR